MAFKIGLIINQI